MANSRSIIVKINSTGTGPFKSLQDRFAVKDEAIPGPGSCKYLIIQTMLLHCQPKRKEVVKEFTRREFEY